MLRANSLLLYKNRPAKLVRIGDRGDRLEIELENGGIVKVRPKDVTVLHPGPLGSLAELKPQEGEIQTAWEMLAGSQTNLPELAELAYGAFSPITAWAAWQQVMEGFYFDGSPDIILARTVEEVAHKAAEREHAAAERQAWQEFLDRLRQGELVPGDREYMKEVENLALGRTERSQLMRILNRSESPENAHALLLELGLWDASVNPYPARMNVALEQPALPVPDLPNEDRRDLTHLASFAIDDEGTDTPDDALALEGSRVWVHVADVAALVPPGSSLDMEARARGSTLHLPEGSLHLLPREVTEKLGLGMDEVNPALSFGIDLSETGEVQGFEIVPSWVRVARLTYEAAETRMEGEPFKTLGRLMNAVRERRRNNNAVMIDFPEVKIDLVNNEVILKPLPVLRSRSMVEEAMILTSTVTARFAVEQGVRLPFSQQEAAEISERPETLSGMFALRRLLKRSRVKTTPGAHSGLGVPAYSQVTSPLRRYLDLVAHQQLRSFLKGTGTMDEAALLERIGAFEAVIGSIRQAEILSEKHWTLVYLLQHPDWAGEGILVDKRGQSGIVIIPALGMETLMHVPRDVQLDQKFRLRIQHVNLPQRDANFRSG